MLHIKIRSLELWDACEFIFKQFILLLSFSVLPGVKIFIWIPTPTVLLHFGPSGSKSHTLNWQLQYINKLIRAQDTSFKNTMYIEFFFFDWRPQSQNKVPGFGFYFLNFRGPVGFSENHGMEWMVENESSSLRVAYQQTRLILK